MYNMSNIYIYTYAIYMLYMYGIGMLCIKRICKYVIVVVFIFIPFILNIYRDVFTFMLCI